MLTLYHYWDSTCSMKARFAVEEKGVPHEKVFVDLLKFEQLRPEYLALNPNGVVPTLVHDGRVIIESSVINEYLEDVFPDPPLLPSDPASRARARMLVRLEESRMHEAMRAPTFNLMIKPMFADASEEELDRVAASHPQKWIGEYWKKTMRSPVDEAAVEKSLTQLREVCRRLDQALEGAGPWLAGKQISLADCAYVSMVDRIEHLGKADMFDDYPALSAWIARLKERPAYARAIPPDDKRMYSPLRKVGAASI